MPRRIGVLLAVVFAAVGLAVPAAQAQRNLLVGIQDDAMVLRGNPTFTFGMMKQLRVQIIRINLNWPDVAERRPAHPQDPADPAYDWRLYDRAIRYAGQNGMRVMLTFLFVPRWANGGKPRNVPPTNYNDLRNFAYAAATRYSGRYIPNTDAFDEVYLPLTRRAGLRNLDAYAHNPYYGKPSETPATRPGGTAVTLGNINTLISLVNKLWGKKRIWITEYGWQTRPPDRVFGVSFARQAAYVRQSFAIGRRNPRIDMIVWFMLRDDTNLSIGWQSGFLTATGRKKPAFSVFARLPH